jgi:hypothetical protein
MLLIHAAEYYVEVDARMGIVKQIETGLLLSYWVCTVVKCRDAQIQVRVSRDTNFLRWSSYLWRLEF